VEKVKQTEAAVADIGELQSQFASKLLEQEEEIQGLFGSAIESTQNIQKGNKELMQAVQRKVSFRICMLFVLICASMCLLFLDWYSV